MGFGAVNMDDDEAPRGGNRGGRGGANAGARRQQNQKMNFGNDEEFPSL